MISINFSLNKELDINNRYISCNKSSYGVDRSTQIPQEIYQKITGKPEQEVIRILDSILETQYQKDHLQHIVDELNIGWKTYGDIIFTIMECTTTNISQTITGNYHNNGKMSLQPQRMVIALLSLYQKHNQTTTR